MAADLLLFIPLAILTNTAFPLPFDHVLLWFASGHTFAEACVVAGFNSGCAGLAALVDVAIIGAVGRQWSCRRGAVEAMGRHGSALADPRTTRLGRCRSGPVGHWVDCSVAAPGNEGSVPDPYD